MKHPEVFMLKHNLYLNFFIIIKIAKRFSYVKAGLCWQKTESLGNIQEMTSIVLSDKFSLFKKN